MTDLQRVHGFGQKIHLRFYNEIDISYFHFFKRSLSIIRTIWRPSWIFGIEKRADIISDHLDQLFVP